LNAGLDPNMNRHFISIRDLSKQTLCQILDLAEKFQNDLQTAKNEAMLQGKWVANVFFESSTRTRCSFEMAAKNLNGQVLNLDVSTSSAQKGEEILDTFKNLEAMGCHVAVIRHAQDGIIQDIANHLTKMHLINAGDGKNEHPSQAMLDMLTIRQHKSYFDSLRVAIVGDIAHSRVARSDIFALKQLGVTDIRLIAPTSLLPLDVQALNVQVFQNLDEGLRDADVIIVLRTQTERILSKEAIDFESLNKNYSITESRLAHAKPNVIVLHPGPLNREIEIASEVANGSHSVILQQVSNGVAVRMAIFEYLFAEEIA
jgi:aspartate carbamoyltransferase catalytic subunit